MSTKTGHSIPDQPESWRWPEEQWRGIVNKIRRAGLSNLQNGRMGLVLPSHFLLTLTTKPKRFAGGITRLAN